MAAAVGAMTRGTCRLVDVGAGSELFTLHPGVLCEHRPNGQAAQAAQASSQAKKDPYQELERLGSLKQQGLITEEEFQKLKTRLLSGT